MLSFTESLHYLTKRFQKLEELTLSDVRIEQIQILSNFYKNGLAKNKIIKKLTLQGPLLNRSIYCKD
jgi:hypothetical protein